MLLLLPLGLRVAERWEGGSTPLNLLVQKVIRLGPHLLGRQMEWEGVRVEETILRLVEAGGGLGEGLVTYLGLCPLEQALGQERRFLLRNLTLSLGQLGEGLGGESLFHVERKEELGERGRWGLEGYSAGAILGQLLGS